MIVFVTDVVTAGLQCQFKKENYVRCVSVSPARFRGKCGHGNGDRGVGKRGC